MDESQPKKPSPQLISNLRELVKTFVHSQEYSTASFWAEKVLFITNDPSDAYERAKCLFNLKEYRRAANTIKSRNLHATDLACLYLAAKCHYMEKDLKEATQVLESPLLINISNNGDTTVNLSASNAPQVRHSSRLNPVIEQDTNQRDVTDESKASSKWLSAIYLLKGKLYEMNDNRQMAQICFKEALNHDLFCYEAFYSLTKHHMLTIEEEKLFIDDLNIDEKLKGNPEMCEFVKFFYSLQGKKYYKPSETVIPLSLDYLSTNVDVETSIAERYYFNCEYYSAYELTTSVLDRDTHHLNCLPIYICTLMEVEKPIELFEVAHKLVDLYPENAISWFAVGCYYQAISKYETARRYLSKATTLDNVFAPAWLVYGHSFAVEREHDQAMAAYFRAYHLMGGCHLPLLFIGVEYGRANDCKLAKKFLSEALKVAPDDPYVLHEFGVVHYRNREFEQALGCFKRAEYILTDGTKFKIAHCVNSEKFKRKWEPLLNNTAHCLRQLKKYDEAIYYHKMSLGVVEANTGTYAALGYLYYLKEDWESALENLNFALSIKYNDCISTNLLDKVIPRCNITFGNELDYTDNGETTETVPET